MHATSKELRLLARQQLSPEHLARINQHIQDCQFCSELLDELIAQESSLAETSEMVLPDSLARWADRMFADVFLGGVVDLTPLVSGPDHALAADTESPGQSDQVRTLYSEDPEIVLRVVEPPEGAGPRHAQLLSDDKSLVSHVLLRVPELGVEVATDRDGHVEFDSATPPFNDTMKWQVKLPDAVFELGALEYDPTAVTESTRVTLSNLSGDRIDVALETLEQGSRVTIELIEFGGTSDYGSVRAVVSVPGELHHADLYHQKPTTFETSEAPVSINIRLYRQ